MPSVKALSVTCGDSSPKGRAKVLSYEQHNWGEIFLPPALRATTLISERPWCGINF